MKNLNVVLLEVDSFNRKTAENIENQTFKTLNALIKKVRKEETEKGGSINVLPLSDFIDSCNNQEIELEGVWVSYVFIDEKL